MGEIEFRLMQDADIDAGLRLCRLAGWDQVHRDWRRFLESPDTLVSAAVRRGEIIGTVATIRYGARFGWIGMVLVHPSAQGRGMGAALLREATDRLVDMPATRLDATPAGQPLYRKHGFVDECSLTRMEARSVSIDHHLPSLVRSMTRGELSDVVARDHEVFGAPRGDLLQWMYDGAPHFAFVAERRRNLCGYLFGRHGHEFDHLGPIVADDLDVAVNLTKAGLAQHRDRAFVMDALHHDESWIRFLETAGFRPQRPFIRMHRGGHASFGLPRQQFAVLGPEFG